MPLPPDINERIAKAKANGFTDAQIQADIQRKYGVSAGPAAPSKPQDLLGSNKVLDFLTGMTGGKQVAKLGGALAFANDVTIPFMSKGGDKRAADASQTQLDQLTQKYVRETLAKYPPGDPRRERALKMAGQGYGETSSFQNDVANTGPNGRELAADVGKMALTAVGAKTPSNFLGKLSLTRSAGAQAGLGAGFGAANAIEAGKKPGDVVSSAAASGLTAGLLRGAMGLGGRAFGALTDSVPKAIYKTSTRVPNKTDVTALLEGGVTGGRDQLKSKAIALVQDAQDAINQSPAAKAGSTNVDEILSYGPIQKLREQARRVGELDAVDAAINKVLPKGTANLDELLAAEVGSHPLTTSRVGPSVVDKPDQLAAIVQAMKGKIPLLEALKQKSAIDATTTSSVFADKSTNLGAQGENAVADAIRNIVSKKAPDVSSNLSDQTSALALLRSLQDYANAKTSPIPFGLGNAVQRLVFPPSIATRAAGASYKLGGPFRKLSQNALMEAIRRLANTGTAQGLGRLFGGQ